MTLKYMYNSFSPESRSTGYQSKSEKVLMISSLRQSSKSSRAVLEAVLEVDGSGKADGLLITLLGLFDVFVHLGKLA